MPGRITIRVCSYAMYRSPTPHGVEARFGGKEDWFKGKISKVRSDGTYDVLYEDGDSERRVKKGLIRALGGSSSKEKKKKKSSGGGSLKSGQVVEARFGGKEEWYKGKISKVRDDGTYDVLYEDGDTERRVEKALIRALGGGGGSSGGT